jgi:Zn-dependent protease
MMIWILLGSMVAFMVLGAANWSWKFTLWLVPVLFLHEAGHWVAMRLFKYRNLRMFFIPMFGAAVMGRHWNVPGWKKALVSLAGPLSGIILGWASSRRLFPLNRGR